MHVVTENQKSMNFDNTAQNIFPRGGRVLQNKFAKRGLFSYAFAFTD